MSSSVCMTAEYGRFASKADPMKNSADVLCADEQSGANKLLRVFHGKRDECDIYMFNNENESLWVETTVKLKDFTGGEYIIYDAAENSAKRDLSDRLK